MSESNVAVLRMSKNSVLKLEICTDFDGASQIRSVPLEAILNVNGKISYKLLEGLAISCALPFSTLFQCDEFEVVSSTYVDDENECVTMSTTEELEDAIEHYAREDDDTLCIKIMLKRKGWEPFEKSSLLDCPVASSMSALPASAEPHDPVQLQEVQTQNEDTSDCFHFEEIEEAERLLHGYYQLMKHASQCQDDCNCSVKDCNKMKQCLQHARTCRDNVSGNCMKCKQILLHAHAQNCRDMVCTIPRCLEFREMVEPQEETVESSPVVIACDTDSNAFFHQASLAEKGRNRLTVLFSSPLLCCDRACGLPSFTSEREYLVQSFKQASRDIEVVFDTASHGRLRAALAQKCTCFHYSGHGDDNFLHFEDCEFAIVGIESLVKNVDGAPITFMFVSTSDANNAGCKFTLAGVPHVVSCERNPKCADLASLTFTQHFYLALATGFTIQESFDQGCKAVLESSGISNPESEVKRFALLPPETDHNVAIFEAKPVLQWPKVVHAASEPGRCNCSELVFRNIMQDNPSPRPPVSFVGREVDMYLVLSAVQESRLISVVGRPGVGRSSLVCALCHHINERRSSIAVVEKIYFVRLGPNPSCREVIAQLHDKLVDSGKSRRLETGIYTDAVIETICNCLKREKALIVFDRYERLREPQEADEFVAFLSILFTETRNVRVLVTGVNPLGVASIGDEREASYELSPLDFQTSVRLFASVCAQKEQNDFYNQVEKIERQLTFLRNHRDADARLSSIFGALVDGLPRQIEDSARATSLYDLEKIGLELDSSFRLVASVCPHLRIQEERNYFCNRRDGLPCQVENAARTTSVEALKIIGKEETDSQDDDEWWATTFI